MNLSDAPIVWLIILGLPINVAGFVIQLRIFLLNRKTRQLLQDLPTR